MKIMNNIKANDTFNMKINSYIKREFYKKCIDNGTTMSKVLKSFIEEYIKNN